MNVDLLTFIKVLEKFQDHLGMLLGSCREYLTENKYFLESLNGPDIDGVMSSFINKKLRDEGIEASLEEINYIGLGISTQILKEASENIKNNPEE